MSLCAPYVLKSLQRIGEGVRSPGNGVTGNCEQPCGFTNPGPLQE